MLVVWVIKVTIICDSLILRWRHSLSLALNDIKQNSSVSEADRSILPNICIWVINNYIHDWHFNCAV